MYEARVSLQSQNFDETLREKENASAERISNKASRF
jgi:hypothetical protein